MRRHNKLLTASLLALLLPCVMIGLLGYQWLRLEREAAARRGTEAAETEASRLRQDIRDSLALLTQKIAPSLQRAAAAGLPFAPPPQPPDPVTAAFLFRRDGQLLYPDYEAAYQRAINDYQAAAVHPPWQRTMGRIETFEGRGDRGSALKVLQDLLPATVQPSLRATVLLHLGRISLAAKSYRAAESYPAQILECCATARDEYGISFLLYAAAQMVAAWEGRGVLREAFPHLALRLGEALQKGTLGHPRDAPEIAALVRRAGQESATSSLLRQAEETTGRVQRHIQTAQRLEKWLAGSGRHGPGSATSAFSLSTFWMDDRPQMVAVCRTGDAVLLAALLADDRLGAWLAARAAAKGHFEAALVPESQRLSGTTLQQPLFPEAPGWDLVLRASETDPALQRQRQTLFAASLAAAVVLLLLLAYFAFRDVSREVELAALRSSFVAAVTHELKTPLTSIRLLAETLRLKRMRDPAAAEEMLAAISEETERLSRLLDNVLNFSRIEKGAHRYQPIDLSLPQAVQAAVRRFQSILDQGGFQLKQENDGNGLFVHADPEALEQALLNLLGNAVKYSGRAREIRLGFCRRGGEAEIRITDFGFGIPRAEQQHIFESFYRAPQAARETEGAGLGLALVKHFAEAHGGRVSVASEQGAGSTFSLWLPAIAEPRSLHRESEIEHGQDPDRRG